MYVKKSFETYFTPRVSALKIIPSLVIRFLRYLRWLTCVTVCVLQAKIAPNIFCAILLSSVWCSFSNKMFFIESKPYPSCFVSVQLCRNPESSSYGRRLVVSSNPDTGYYYLDRFSDKFVIILCFLERPKVN